MPVYFAWDGNLVFSLTGWVRMRGMRGYKEKINPVLLHDYSITDFSSTPADLYCFPTAIDFLGRRNIQSVRKEDEKQLEFICVNEGKPKVVSIAEDCEDQHPTQNNPQQAINSEDRSIRGLRKLGNTCFKILRNLCIFFKKAFVSFSTGYFFIILRHIQSVRKEDEKQLEFICVNEGKPKVVSIAEDCEDQHPTQNNPQQAINSEDRSIRGLRKLGNTCFKILRNLCIFFKKAFVSFSTGYFFIILRHTQSVRKEDEKQLEFICANEAPSKALSIDEDCENQLPTQNNPQQYIDSENKPIRGLRNLGNTCFMNSVLQCLSHTLPLRHFYVSYEYNQCLNSRGDLSNAFSNVMVNLWSITSEDSVVPYELKRQVEIVTPRFIGYDQHDAHEFMRFLLNELHEEINRASVEGRKSPADNETLEEACARYLTWEDSRISELFGGMLRSEVCCSVCSNQSTVYIPFLDIALPIPELSYSSTSDPAVHLTDCLNMLITEETLDEEERPYCNKCMDLTRSTKQLMINKLPRFFVIQLKRFSYYPQRTKLSTPVKFDETWKIPDSANKTHTYSLYGIACHSGGISGGHYISCCKYSGVWRCFNDSMAGSVSWEHVKDQEAYILFYELV